MAPRRRFLAQLRQYALDFDQAHGCYPEDYWEGLSFYQYVLHRETGKEPTSDAETMTAWRAEVVHRKLKGTNHESLSD